MALMNCPAAAKDSTTSGLKEILKEIDPEALNDSQTGFRALQGERLKKTVRLLSSPGTLPLFWVLAAVLGGVRYICKYLQASVRSVRIKAASSGYTKLPPVMDLAHSEWSPAVVCQQYLSALVVGGVRSVTSPLWAILRRATRESGKLGGWIEKELMTNLRVAINALNVSLDWRLRRPYERTFPMAFARTLDPRTAAEVCLLWQRRFFRKFAYCVGFTMEDLRKVLRPVAMKLPRSWVLFWQKALFALWDTVDANTFSTERLHAAHQQLLPGDRGKGLAWESAKTLLRRVILRWLHLRWLAPE